jgi:hypothetical protein
MKSKVALNIADRLYLQATPSFASLNKYTVKKKAWNFCLFVSQCFRNLQLGHLPGWKNHRGYPVANARGFPVKDSGRCPTRCASGTVSRKNIGMIPRRSTGAVSQTVGCFHGTFREGTLNVYLFDTLKEVHQTVEPWIKEYNTIRLYGALQGMTPYQFAARNA